MMMNPGLGQPSRMARRDRVLSFLSSLPAGVTYVRNEAVASVRNASGKLVASSAHAPRFDHDSSGNALGLLVEGSVVNKCTNTNCNPSATTNMTKGGDAASTLSVVSDSAALAKAKLDAICTNGNVFRLDNSGGSTTAYVDISGTTGNTNPHTFSVWIRGDAGGAGSLTRTGSGGSSVNITGGLAYQRVVLGNETPNASSNSMRIRANAGRVLYFILNQLEEMPFATSEIMTAGAAATRASDRVTLSLAKTSYFSEASGYIGMRYRPKGFLAATYQYMFVADNGSNSQNTMGIRGNYGAQDISAYVRAGNVSQNSNSNNDTHIAGAMNACGITWGPGESTILSGGTANTKTYASDATGITTLNIGARTAGADPFFGHITKLVIGKGHKSTAALGAKLHEAGDVVIIGGGQSLIRGYFNSNETDSDAGKQKVREVIGLAMPRKITYFVDGATGGSGVLSTTDPVNYWIDADTGARGPAFETFYNNIVASGIVPSAVLFELGETDSGAIKNGDTTRAEYKQGMIDAFADIRASLGDVPIILQKIGRRTGFEFDGAVQVIREVQDELIHELSYVHRGSETYDTTLYDSVHPDDAGFLKMAERNARIVGNLFGAGFTGTTGPRITNVSRSGTAVTVTLMHDAGTDFTPTSSIAGFHYFGGTTEITINAAVRTNATTVTLTLATTPSGAERLYYIYDEEASVTVANLLKDNASLTMPLQTY